MPPPSSFIKTLFLFFLIFTTYLSSDAEGYTTCEPFSCGKFNNISFPFWRSDQPEYCGHPKLKLDCQQDNVTIDMMSHTFYVIDIKPTSKVLKIASVDLLDDPCPNEYISFELDFDFFNYTSNDGNYTLLYDCSPNPLKYSLNLDDLKPFSCPIDSGFQEAFFVSSSDVANLMDLVCNKNISVSVLREAVKDTSFVKDVIKEGFEVLWSGVDEDQCDGCKQHGGRCGHNASVDEFICLCYNQQSYGGGCSKSLARSPLAAPTTTTRPTPANSLLPPNSLIFPKNSPLSPHAPSMYSSFS